MFRAVSCFLWNRISSTTTLIFSQAALPSLKILNLLISSNLTERMEREEKERKENDRTKSQHSTKQHNKQYVAFASDESLLYKTMQKVINKDLFLILYVLPNHHLIMAGVIWAINKQT